jgi:hypothetical protein
MVDALVAAVRPRRLDPDAEARAVAAFRDAWNERRGVQPERTRRRDDWRPRARRRAGRTLHTLLAVLLGGATLGGVAVASIGIPPHDAAPRRPARSEAPVTPGLSGPMSGRGLTSGGNPGIGGEVSQTPGRSAEKAAEKATKARRKADEKAAKAADKASKASDKARKDAAKAAKSAGKSAQSKKK